MALKPAPRDERIVVGGTAPYAVTVGRSVLWRIASDLGEPRQVGLIHAAQPSGALRRVEALLRSAGHAVTPIGVPDGEAAKSLEVAKQCWDALGAAGFTRSDIVVGLGGGAVTDLAGFVAATWLRGIKLINVPSTLLGMVDAAVGGKTGLNVAAGKNLVGAFHPPVAVIADLDLLDTLPVPEYRSGLAEVVKCGFIADPVILDLLTRDPAGRADQGELVVRAIRVKAEVVSEDLTDHGRREMLNYGHTLGHAIESVTAYSVRHGEAIGIGMVFAAQLARHAGLLDRASADRHRALISAMGLPTTCDLDLRDVVAKMRVDKKARGSSLRFVVLEGIGRPRILEAPEYRLIESAFGELMHN